MKQHTRLYQRGATLIIGLVLLLVLTLMGIGAMNVSSLNLRNVANMQYRQMALAAVMEAAENYLSDPGHFVPSAPAATYITNGLTVNLSAPHCIYTHRSGVGWSGKNMLCDAAETHCTPSWANYWDFSATVTDPMTGATSNVRYGVMIEGGGCA